MNRTAKRLLVYLAILLVCWAFYKMLQGRALYLQIRALAGPSAIPTLVDGLDDQGEVVRAVVVSRLSGMGEAAVPALVRALQDPNATRREGAAISLGRMVVRSTAPVPALQKNAGPALAEALGDPDDRVRAEAARALWLIDRRVERDVPALIACLGSEDTHARWVAADTLEGIGPPAKEAVPALLEAYKKGGTVSVRVGDALRKVDPQAADQAGVRR